MKSVILRIHKALVDSEVHHTRSPCNYHTQLSYSVPPAIILSYHSSHYVANAPGSASSNHIIVTEMSPLLHIPRFAEVHNRPMPTVAITLKCRGEREYSY